MPSTGAIVSLMFYIVWILVRIKLIMFANFLLVMKV